MTSYRKSMIESLAEVRGLQEDNMDLMRKAAGGAMQTIKMKDGKLQMDMFTASAIMQIYDKLNSANQKKMAKMINDGKKSGIMKLQDFAMKQVKSENDPEIEEEVDLVTELEDLGRTSQYNIKNGKIHMSKRNYAAKPKDYKGKRGGKPTLMALDPKSGATTSFEVVFEEVGLDEKLISARGKDIAQKMNKSKTMKPFAKEVAKMQTVTPDKLERMLPDYVAGKDIHSMFEEVDLDEMKSGNYALAVKGKFVAVGSKADMMKLKKQKGGEIYMSPGAKVGDKAEEVDLDEVVHWQAQTKDGKGLFQIVDRDTKGMAGKQDKFKMQIVDKRGKVIKDLGSHVSVDSARKFARNRKIVDPKNLGQQMPYDPKRDKGKGFTTEEVEELDEFVLETMATIWFANVALPVLIGGGLVAAGGVGLGIIKVISKIKEIRKLLKDKKMKKFIKDNKGKKKLDASDKAELNKIVSPAEKSKIKDEVEDVVKKEQLKEISPNVQKSDVIVMKKGPTMKSVVGASAVKKAERDGWKVDHAIVKGRKVTSPKDIMKAVKSADKLGIGEEVSEGTWKMPKNKKQIAPLLKLMRKPIKLGKDGDDAADVVSPYIGDDELLDDLYVAGKKNPKGDARPAIRDALQRFGLPWEEEVEIDEASARADARRSMRADPDMRQKKFSKDVSATDDDVKGASKNIIMQMRKAQSLGGNFAVEFGDKKKVKIPAKMAVAVQQKYNSFKKPMDKEKFQAKISKSYKDMLRALKEETKHVSTLERINTKIQEKKNG